MRTFVTTVPADQPPGLLDEGRLADAAKWAAGGFALLSGLLAFFGLKDGALDQLLRAHEERALYVFVLIGLGVGAALLGPALRTGRQLPVWSLCIAVAALGGGALWLAAADEQDTWRRSFGLVTFAVPVLVGLALPKARMSAVAAAISLAVISTGLGLYGAATLAVTARTRVGVPQVTSSLEGEVLTVAVRARGVDASAIRIFVRGERRDDQAVTLVDELLESDGIGDVDAEFKVAVSQGRWDGVVVSHCAGDHNGGCAGRRTELVAARFEPEPSDARVGAFVTSAGKAVRAEVRATQLTGGIAVDVRVRRLRGISEVTVGTARLVADAAGVATWKSAVPGAKAGDRVVVDYALCTPACPADRTTLAEYLVP